jgi:alcohol dehydrogenase
MIANALGAQVIAVDIDAKTLELAAKLGATVTVNAAEDANVVGMIRDATGRGAHVSLDARGSAKTCSDSILCLRKRGRHVQVGLLVGDDHLPRIPMDQVVANELEIYGSHGMQAIKYDAVLKMIVSGTLEPRLIVGKTVPLEEAPAELEKMGHFGVRGIAVIDRF